MSSEVTYDVESLIVGIFRNYPAWPSTFSTCECGSHWGRGGSQCAACLEDELAAIIGKPLAWELHQTIKQYAKLRDEAMDKARKLDDVKAEQDCDGSQHATG